jgi:hypothetical protein
MLPDPNALGRRTQGEYLEAGIEVEYPQKLPGKGDQKEAARFGGLTEHGLCPGRFQGRAFCDVLRIKITGLLASRACSVNTSGSGRFVGGNMNYLGDLC